MQRAPDTDDGSNEGHETTEDGSVLVAAELSVRLSSRPWLLTRPVFTLQSANMGRAH